jgi:DNA-binding NarL/FixJ family response regulator
LACSSSHKHIEISHAVELVTLGGFGYLLKDRVLEVGEFLAAAERVAQGGSALDPKVVASLVSTRGDQGPLAQLTERERDVLELMAEGLTNAGIAKRLYLSERTVGAHVRHLLMNSMCPKARTATAASSPCSRT